MIQARVAAGVAAAFLVVGAVVHFQPTQRLSAATLVSAALDLETLQACEAKNGPAAGDDPTTALGGLKAGQTGFQVDWDGTGATAATRLFVQTAGPCVCHKNVCTNGRVCDPAGELGQCYLPRCPAPGNNVPVEYTAGCFCSADASFTSSNKARAYVAGVPRDQITATLADDGVATETSKCGTKAVCYKGERCDLTQANGQCDAGPITIIEKTGTFTVNEINKVPQTTAYAIPLISSNVYTNPKLFAICKSSAVTTRRCKLPTTAVTQTGEEGQVECEVVA